MPSPSLSRSTPMRRLADVRRRLRGIAAVCTVLVAVAAVLVVGIAASMIHGYRAFDHAPLDFGITSDPTSSAAMERVRPFERGSRGGGSL